MITFEKPIGSHADCKELEYVAALHQSGPTIRQDASITGKQIQRKIHFDIQRETVILITTTYHDDENCY
jgi:hypothetical protein